MRREEQRILAGSLNVLPPSDKTPENDAIELINFRVDQEGVLRGGPGLALVASGLPTPIHSLCRVDGTPLATLPIPAAQNNGVTILPGNPGMFTPSAPTFLVGAAKSLYLVTGATAHLLSTGLDGAPLSFVVWNGFVWIMNYNRPMVFLPYGTPTAPNQYASAPWMQGPSSSAPAAAAVTGSTGGPNGTYQYYVTFVDITGLESNLGPASGAVAIANGQSGSLTAIPTGSATTFSRRIYRTGGTLGAAYQVTEIQDNTTTTYTDGASDLALTQKGIQAPGSDATVGDNGLPPAALGIAGPYFNFLVAYGNFTYPHRLYWSQDGVPVFPANNWVDVGGPDDAILRVTLHPRVAIVYKQRSIWRLVGDPITGVLEQCSAAIGAAAVEAVAPAGPVDYVVSRDGAFLFNLDSEQRVSEKLDPIFAGVPGWTALGASDLPSHIWSPLQLSTNEIDYAGAPLVLAAWLNGTLLVSDGQASAFLLHAATGRWAAYAPVSGITAAWTEASAFAYYLADSAGNIWSNSLSGTTASVLSVWQTRFLDQGLGDQPKRYSNFVLDMELEGATANVYIFYDNGAAGGTKAQALAGTFTGTARKKFEIDYAELQEGGKVATNVSVRVEITSSTGSALPPALHGLYVYYEPVPRSTSATATAGFALDPERGVWQVKEIEYDLEPLVAGSGGNVTSQMLSDLSGNEVVLRQTDTIASSGWRRNYQLPQNTAGTGWWTGRLFQLLLSMPPANGQFRLWGARLLARKVGTYIEDYEAQAGFLWDSWWLNFGSVQVKVFDQIKVEIETAATVTVTVWTELPGETPAVVATANFTGSGARKWFTVELPADTLGREIRVQIGANGTWTFYAGMVSARIVGRYLSAAQGDQLRTLEQDFGSERIKEARKLEIDLDGTATLTVWTDEPGGLASRLAKTLTTMGRQTVRVNLPPNVRGRLWRIDATTAGVARIYAIRAWMRITGEAGPQMWAWQNFALEPTDTLPRWLPLPVTPTPEEWTWVPVPLAEPLDATPVPTAVLPYAS